MMGDKDRLQQILLNILLNSIKFTTQGYIIFSVNIYESNLNKGLKFVSFAIKDSGIGIEEFRIKKIFNLFEKEDNQHIDDYVEMADRSNLPIKLIYCSCQNGLAFELEIVQSNGWQDKGVQHKERGVYLHLHVAIEL